MPRHATMSATIAILLVLASVACAQTRAPVLLRYQWEQGEEITLDVNVEMAGEVVTDDLLLDPPGRQRSDMTATMSMAQYQTIEAIDDDGNATVVNETGVIEMDMETEGMGAQHMTIDMANGKLMVGDKEMPAPAGMAKMAGPVRQTLSPRGEVLDTQMSFDPAEMFNIGATAPLKMLEMFKTSNMTFPEQEVGEGYCWVQAVDLTPTVPEGEEAPEDPPTMAYSMSYAHAGYEDLGGVECVRIQMIGTTELSNLSGMPMPGIDGDATSSLGPAHYSISGTIWFDNAAGCVRKVEAVVILDMVQEVEGTFKMGDKTRDVHSRTTMTGFEIYTTMERIDEG